MALSNLANAALKPFGLHIQRTPKSVVDTRCLTLRPAGEPRGRVLFAYILEPLLHIDQAPAAGHTHNLESVLMAKTWLDRGFVVDAIDYRNNIFEPVEHYDWFTGARLYFAEVASRLPARARKIVHLDTSHFAVNNGEAYARLAACQRRRGSSPYDSIRLIEHSAAIDAADFGIVLGNKVTEETYGFAGRPLFRLDVPSVIECAIPEAKSWDHVRNRFLWLGSQGALHKGLDIVLEAFARMPDKQLTICGSFDHEPSFVEAFRTELALPNVQTTGWIDVAGEALTKPGTQQHCARLSLLRGGSGWRGRQLHQVRADPHCQSLLRD